MPDTRESLSISEENELWIQAQIDGGEFASRSEVVNELIRKEREKTRERDFIRAMLIEGEKSVEEHGWVTETPEEMFAGFKERAQANG